MAMKIKRSSIWPTATVQEQKPQYFRRVKPILRQRKIKTLQFLFKIQ